MVQLDDFLIHCFHQGNCLEMYKVFGAHLTKENEVEGVRFTLYAPNARKVQVIGSFNDWNGSQHEMQRYHNGGIYTLFIAGAKEYDSYKYRIQTQNGTYIKVPVRSVIETAKKVLYTGHIGDGKIFVYDVENVVKVRTGV